MSALFSDGRQKERDRLEELASGRLSRLLLKYSWPALLAMTLNALYAVVDRVFIGQGCGLDPMTGLQLAMPVMMFLTAFGPLIGVGHASLLSIKLGESDSETCEKLLGQTIALKIGLYAILLPIIYLNIDSVLLLCGAENVTPEAASAAKTYLRIVLSSHVFSHLAFGLSALLRAEGAARRSMMCMIVGFGANLILDPLFIFVFDMGIAGAAWATNIAMFLSCVWAFGYYLRDKTIVKLRLSRIRIYPRICLRALSIGMAPYLQHLMSAIIVASLQISFSRWIPDKAACTSQIASLGVFNSALILVLMPVLGCQQGLQPIIGFNWGARNFRRVLGVFKLGLFVTTVLTVIAFIIQVIPPFPMYLARLFIDSAEIDSVALAAHDLQLSNCFIWCISLNIVATTYYQSIGRSWMAVALSMFRQGVVMLPIIWFLPYCMADKPFAIWLSMPISDIACFIATLVPILLQIRFLKSVRSRDTNPEGR